MSREKGTEKRVVDYLLSHREEILALKGKRSQRQWCRIIVRDFAKEDGSDIGSGEVRQIISKIAKDTDFVRSKEATELAGMMHISRHPGEGLKKINEAVELAGMIGISDNHEESAESKSLPAISIDDSIAGRTACVITVVRFTAGADGGGIGKIRSLQWGKRPKEQSLENIKKRFGVTQIVCKRVRMKRLARKKNALLEALQKALLETDFSGVEKVFSCNLGLGGRFVGTLKRLLSSYISKDKIFIYPGHGARMDTNIEKKRVHIGHMVNIAGNIGRIILEEHPELIT